MCNCKKKPEVIEPQSIPQTPDELHAQEMTKWNGGPVELTKEEIDWFNNIDTINPIKDNNNG